MYYSKTTYKQLDKVYHTTQKPNPIKNGSKSTKTYEKRMGNH